MSRIKCITALRDGPAVSAINASIERIRDHVEKWGAGCEPEEIAVTKYALGLLLEAQAELVVVCTRQGEQMNRRITLMTMEGAA